MRENLISTLREEAKAARTHIEGQRFGNEARVIAEGILHLARLCAEAADALDAVIVSGFCPNGTPETGLYCRFGREACADICKLPEPQK